MTIGTCIHSGTALAEKKEYEGQCYIFHDFFDEIYNKYPDLKE
jgi:hypothetical protein